MNMSKTVIGAALAAIVLASPVAVLADTAQPLKIGKVTFHAAKYVGKDVTLVGYPLQLPPGTVYFSDEATGKIGPHDLAVTGPGLDTVQIGHKYVLTGTFKKAGKAFSNASQVVLELSQPPAEAN
jgi:hypothetical protein